MFDRVVALIGAGIVCLGTATAAEVPEFLRLSTGCFEVSYRYVEEGAKVVPVYRETSHEWVVLKEIEGTYHLKHYGIVGQDEEKMTMAHWTQVWRTVSDQKWLQIVGSPSGVERYRCEAPVTGEKGSYQRTCLATGAPKPRRDKDRKDYETLDRRHIISFSTWGWSDVQKNVKRAKNGESVADEVGWNDYRKVDESHCRLAIDQFGR